MSTTPDPAHGHTQNGPPILDMNPYFFGPFCRCGSRSCPAGAAPDAPCENALEPVCPECGEETCPRAVNPDTSCTSCSWCLRQGCCAICRELEEEERERDATPFDPETMTDYERVLEPDELGAGVRWTGEPDDRDPGARTTGAHARRVRGVIARLAARRA